MREKFVVLRETSVPDATRDVFGGLDRSPWEGRGPLTGGFRDLSFSSRPSLPRVTVETLDRRDLPSLTGEPGVRAVAPSIPLRLIEPVSREAAPSATGPTWGVRAVGADTSPFTGQRAVVAVLDTGMGRGPVGGEADERGPAQPPDPQRPGARLGQPHGPRARHRPRRRGPGAGAGAGGVERGKTARPMPITQRAINLLYSSSAFLRAV